MTAQPEIRTTTADDEWTINRLLSWTSDFLARAGIDEPRLATEVLLARALDCRRIDLYARMDSIPDAEAMGRFRDWVRRAAKHEPIAYLVGEKEFFSLSFRVTSDVLIPRPETETLVECVIDHCSAKSLTQPRLLDLGTGSGCIAVAVLTQIPEATVVATDVSEPALEIAQSNAERHAVTDRFRPVTADRLQLDADVVPDGGFDVIMANPPYVAQEEMDALAETVRRFEPASALTDGGDGLSFYREMAVAGPALLADGGVMIVEVGAKQAEVVVALMTSGGGLTLERIVKDRVVGIERVLVLARA